MPDAQIVAYEAHVSLVFHSRFILKILSPAFAHAALRQRVDVLHTSLVSPWTPAPVVRKEFTCHSNAMSVSRLPKSFPSPLLV